MIGGNSSGFRTFIRPRALPLVLLVAVVMVGGLAAPGCGGQARAGKLEVTYYYLPG